MVLDIDRLASEEGEKWVFTGAGCLYPEYRRCLVSLSRAGADAVEIREFDLGSKAFVKDGFRLPESKGGAAWRDSNSLYVARDFGLGSMTKSGYPRQIKLWKRGTPLAAAELVFEAGADDVGAWPQVTHEAGYRWERYDRVISTRFSEKFVWHGDRWVKLDVPQDADLRFAARTLYLRLRSDWEPANAAYKAGSLLWQPANAAYKAGSLLAMDAAQFFAGARDFETVFTPSERVSLQDYTITKNHLVLDVLDNVQARVVEAKRMGTAWTLRNVFGPTASSVTLSALDRHASDDYWVNGTSFLEPSTLSLAKAGSASHANWESLKGLPAFFDAKGLTAVQHEATSKDGTKIPYFLVMRGSATLDGSTPTILYGYGGFEQSMTPFYSGTVGTAWLERGGAYVLANLRGGGEFGPQWHLTARREGRQKAHDDFIAVAEDLIARKVTSPRHLGIMGGSQGGLLVGAAFTQRPELFKAAVSAVPLLDMKRYHKLLAGASWMGEYGNPDDPADWAFISAYSPYQRVSKDIKYPKVLFTTSTRDDRVHPGHARKMAAHERAGPRDAVLRVHGRRPRQRQ